MKNFWTKKWKYQNILNFFNPELLVKGTESTIKNNLKKVLTGLRGFKFVTTLERIRPPSKRIDSKYG